MAFRDEKIDTTIIISHIGTYGYPCKSSGLRNALARFHHALNGILFGFQ